MIFKKKCYTLNSVDLLSFGLVTTATTNETSHGDIPDLYYTQTTAVHKLVC